MSAPADPSALIASLGITMDAELLRRALTHRSYAYEHGGLPHNERLEFLGDAVLGIVVTDALFRAHPDLSEGRLAKLRASVVNMKALAGIARGVGVPDPAAGDGPPIGLGAYLLLGRGEEGTGGRTKPSILADALEALFGAIYVEHGLETASRVIHDLFDDLLHDVASGGAGLDWKTSLQELTAELGLGVPDYLMSSTGPDHEKTFTARAQVAGEQFGSSTGRSKKEAEQLAAETAWRVISARHAARTARTGGTADTGGATSTSPSTADPEPRPSGVD